MKLRSGIGTGAATLGALIALASISTSAVAQGAPPIWTGFYLGGSLGIGKSDAKWKFGDATTADHKGFGGLAGLQAGYNWQSGSILAGVEADYSWARVKGSASCPNPAFNCGSELSNMASVRGRLGWVVTPTAMVYFTAGLGHGEAKWTAKDALTNTAIGNGGFTQSKNGLVLGGGAEFMLAKNWTMKAEYLRYNLGSVSGVPGTAASDLRMTADTFKLGLNYKF